MRAVGARVAIGLSTALACSGPAIVRAQQQPSWVLLPSASEPVPEGWGDSVRAVASRLRAAGIELGELDEARRVFERRQSAEPAPVERSELEQLRDRIDRAMVLVATGQRRGALSEMSGGMELLRRATETINREARVARGAFDGCLITVRALIELRRRDEARERARECQRLFPDVEPDPREHPPWVIGWLAEVRAEQSMEPRGALRIVAERAGCGVYLQGLRVGATPFERGDFTPGEQRIQVDCGQGRPGRVHRVVLGAEPTTVRIDTRFDAALRSEELLELRYATAAEEDRRRLEDGLAVARVLDAPDLLLVTAEEAALRIDRVRVADGSVLASVRAPRTAAGAGAAELDAAARALARGESLHAETWRPPASRRAAATTPGAGPGVRPVPRPARASSRVARVRAPAPRRADEPPSAAKLLVGVSGGVCGLATLGAGWGLYATTGREDGAWDIGVGLVGSAITTLAVAVMTPTDDGLNGAGWVSGGLGLSVAALSVGAFAFDGTCKRHDGAGRCVAAHDSLDLGVLLLATAAPFFAVPLVQLVAKLTESSDATTVTATPTDGGVMVGLRGSLR